MSSLPNRWLGILDSLLSINNVNINPVSDTLRSTVLQLGINRYLPVRDVQPSDCYRANVSLCSKSPAQSLESRTSSWMRQRLSWDLKDRVKEVKGDKRPVLAKGTGTKAWKQKGAVYTEGMKGMRMIGS